MNTFLSKSYFAIFFYAFLTRFVIKPHSNTRLAKARWTSYTSAVFFSRENKKCPWKLFLNFFTGKISFRAQNLAIFCLFSQVFIFQFLCRKSDFFFQKPQSENQKCNFLEISRETILFNGHFLKVFWFFSRFFFSGIKKTLYWCKFVRSGNTPPPFNIRGLEPPQIFLDFGHIFRVNFLNPL